MIVVTGGTGTTGHYVIRALIDVGLPVRDLVHSERSADRLPRGVADYIAGDMLVPTDVRSVMAGADAVVHIGPACIRARLQWVRRSWTRPRRPVFRTSY